MQNIQSVSQFVHEIQNLIKSRLQSYMTESFDLFSDRERECIFLLSLGYTARDMALELHLSVRTVEHLLESIRQKVGCKKKSQIIKTILNL